ncbi:MAG: cell division protein ZapB [Spirochaetaceae bacterium]|jgi:chromosome segregation ATPase|nr:cell division protein ZapB [Spirochaetaceae bacterium]
MVTLEQIKLLETKVVKALDFVNQVTGENTLLKEKLDTYQKRIDELEVLIQRFKEDQGRIEEGIISALNRLNQFEDAVEKSLSIVQTSFVNSPEEVKSGDPAREVLKPEIESSPPGSEQEREYPPESEEDEVLLTAAEPEKDFSLASQEKPAVSEPEISETLTTRELDIF